MDQGLGDHVVTDYASIVAQLGPYRTIQLEGEIEFPQPLDLGTHTGLKLTGSARITAAPGCGEMILMRGLKQAVEGLILHNDYGLGIRSYGGGGHRLCNNHISTKGHGYFGENGAGAWLTDNHFNGLRAPQDPPTFAMLFGQWDAGFLQGNLSESHLYGWRGGWNGQTANIIAPSLTIDRAYIGVVFEPLAGGSIANCRFGHVWAAGQAGGGLAPVMVNAGAGTLSANTILDLRASDFIKKEVYGTSPGVTVRFQEHY